MIGQLKDLRTQLLLVAGVLLLIDLGAAGVLLSPLGRSQAARQQEFERLRVERMQKAAEALPAEGMDGKIKTAREQEIQFNSERLPAHYSAMSEQLARIAKESGAGVTSVKYDTNNSRTSSSQAQKDTPQGYEAVGITIQLHGSYEQQMRFINELERQKTMFLIDAVSFGGTREGSELAVAVHVSTYLRSAA